MQTQFYGDLRIQRKFILSGQSTQYNSLIVVTLKAYIILISSGDKDLVSFLEEEIEYEQENITDGPKFHEFKVTRNKNIFILYAFWIFNRIKYSSKSMLCYFFKVDVNGTKVTLSRDFKGERWVITLYIS